MQRKIVRRGFGALLVTAALGIPGLAAAEPAGPPRELGPGFFWDLLTGIFLGDEAATTPSQGSGTGGDVNNGGGAMDPNGGGPKPTPPPPPPPEP
jgi:hypothetical protein